MESHTTVVIPFDEGIIFVRLLNCAKFPSRLSEIAQTLVAISETQFLDGWGRVRRAAASWHGLHQALRRGMRAAVGELYAVWVSASW